MLKVHRENTETKDDFIMRKKFCTLFITLLFSSIVVSVSAQVSVGLKEGDWVRYEVTYTGSPPEGFPTNTRIEVLEIADTTITVKIENDRLNRTHTSATGTFDLEDGAPDLIIVPANLSVGDQVVNKEWNITFKIEGVADYDFKDVTRELVFANIVVDGIPVEYNWDRETGIFIQIDQTTDSYTQKYLAYDTNIVQAQATNLDPMLFYGIVTAVVIIIIVAALLVLKRKK